ncbi:bifunctional heptose 7-phosphate kinase/heptose 1-phosphate adenyltransferase, partial [Dehalococcoides mccartyi]|nr:bifunctional heptose 7-phosphate kinase/heptose 1-phosphate adenyltransferase [Dehalococcoides mccartyi]
MSDSSVPIFDLKQALGDIRFEASVKIAVIGDFMIDHYLWGFSDRISPEAPVPIVNIQYETDGLGGAGNVVANLRALGASVAPVGVVGKDSAGTRLLKMVESLGVTTEGLVTHEEQVTSEKTRVMVQNQNILRLDRESPIKVESEILESRVKAALSGAGACVISDYGKGVCSKKLVQFAIMLAKTQGIPVIVDPKGRKFEKYRGATCVTPNLSEFSQVIDLEDVSDESIGVAGERLRSHLELDSLLVTRSGDGMTLITADGAQHIEVTSHDVFDVAGAGDTATAALAWCAALGVPLSTAVRIANLAAGIAVTRVGVVAITKSELLEVVQLEGVSSSNVKIFDLNELKDRVSTWKSSGETIVFTNGCYDIIHPGHIGVIESASAMGDRLVVALNSDDSTRRLKGPGRPVNNFMHRATIVAALGAVDAVITFDEDTPLSLIEQIVPDVLVKGADYDESEVVGGDIVKKNG